MSNEQLNTLVIKAAKRADKAPLEVLGPTFVPLRPLMVHLESNEHHVLFGRRGTGKTHVMRYLQNQLRRDAELVAYLDLRQVDSAAGVISSSGAGPADQATNVLIDIVESVHNQVLDQVLEGVSSTNLTQISEALDSIARVATQLRLVGDTEIEAEVEAACERDVSHRMDVSISSEPRLAMGKERRLTNAQSARSKRIDRGLETSHSC